MTKNIREQVVNLLLEIERDKSYAQLALKNELKDITGPDKGFMTEVVYGTLKYQIKLDYIIDQFSKTPVRKMKPLIRQLFRMSVYQLMYLDKVPASAVINEAVKIAKKRKFVSLSGFVNGVLRTIDRERNNIKYPSKEKETVRYMSVMYSLPEWMIETWLKSYDMTKVEAICSALNERAQVCIRVNTLKATKEEVIKRLEAEGVTVMPGEFLDEAMYLKNVDNIQNMSSFKEGLWTVQDESAMLVGKVIAPKAGERILDLCSAPGGKSIHMAELMQNKGEIISCDIHPHKLELIAKNAERMGVTIIKPTLQDGTICNEAFVERFDRILVDAPCSGLGIMKRKPDIRYNKEATDLEDIAAIQRAILTQAVKYLKPEGILVYSTCTISKAENEEMVAFMTNELGLELNKIVDTIPKVLQKEVERESMIQILPQIAGTDGFFIAGLKKRGI